MENNIVLMADEVYQPNIYQDEKPFLSARCGLPSCHLPVWPLMSCYTGLACLSVALSGRCCPCGTEQ